MTKETIDEYLERHSNYLFSWDNYHVDTDSEGNRSGFSHRFTEEESSILGSTSQEPYERMINYKAQLEEVIKTCDKNGIETEELRLRVRGSLEGLLENFNMEKKVHRAPGENYLNYEADFARQVRTAYNHCVRHSDIAEKFGLPEYEKEFQELALQISMQKDIDGMTPEETIERFSMDEQTLKKVAEKNWEFEMEFRHPHYHDYGLKALETAERYGLDSDKQIKSAKKIINEYVYSVLARDYLRDISEKYDLNNYLRDKAKEKFYKTQDLERRKELNEAYNLGLLE